MVPPANTPFTAVKAAQTPLFSPVACSLSTCPCMSAEDVVVLHRPQKPEDTSSTRMIAAHAVSLESWAQMVE